MTELKSNAEVNIGQLAIELLEEGKEYGYSELCKTLGVRTYKNGSNAYKSQLKDVFDARYVEEIYGEYRGRKVKRYKIGKVKEFTSQLELSCNVSKNDWNSKGIYSIKYNNTVYIGKTEVGFRIRFMQHYRNYGNIHEKTKKLILDGGRFTPIYFMNNIDDSELFLMVEDMFISIYKEMGYNVVNERTNVPIPKIRKPRPKTKKIKIFEKDLEKILNFAIENNISIEIF